MRWRLLDTVDRLEPWALATGRKAVSLEEYRLGEPLGRDRALPETLVLACCAELARWLVLRSSEFRHTAAPSEVTGFSFPSTTGPGEVLRVAVTAQAHTATALSLLCRADVQGREVAKGALAVDLLPAAEWEDSERVGVAWRELRGPA